MAGWFFLSRWVFRGWVVPMGKAQVRLPRRADDDNGPGWVFRVGGELMSPSPFMFISVVAVAFAFEVGFAGRSGGP